MAVNKYDSPAQDRYFNTNVPLPYEQLMGTVVARQAQLQREQDMLNKTYEDTENLTYIPGTKDEGYIRDYLGKTSDLVSKYYGQDLSDPIVKQQMRREFSSITNKTRIKDIQSSATNWMANNKIKQQRIADGTYDPYFDEQDPAKNPNFSSEAGVYQYTTPGRVNEQEVADQYFNVASITKGKTLSPQGDYNMHGATEDMTNSIADNKWQDFINQPGIPQFINKLADQKGLDKNNSEVRQQIAQEYLRERGKAHTWNTQGSATLDAQVRATQSKKTTDKTDIEYKNSTQMSSVRITPHYDPLNVGKIEFDKENRISNLSPESILVEKERANQLVPYSSTELITKSDEAIRAEKREILVKVREAFPQLKGLSDKDTYKAYQDLIADANAIPDLPIVDVPGVPREALKEQLSTSMLNRRLMVMDDFGSSDLRASTDTGQGSPLEDLGYTTQSLKQAIADGVVTVGGLAQNGPMAGMVQIEVPDISKKGGGKGQMRKVYITLNDQFTAYMSPTNDVYNNIRSMKRGITALGYDKDGKQIGIEVIPSIQLDPNSKKWVYEYQLNQGYITKDNKLITPDPLNPDGIPTTIDRIGDMQLYRLTNSGVLSSEINFTKNSY